MSWNCLKRQQFFQAQMTHVSLINVQVKDLLGVRMRPQEMTMEMPVQKIHGQVLMTHGLDGKTNKVIYYKSIGERSLLVSTEVTSPVLRLSSPVT